MADNLPTSVPPVMKAKKPTFVENFKQQVAAGPLPQTLVQLKAKYQPYRRQILLVGAGFVVLLVVVLGLRFGGLLARIFRPGDLEVTQLPTVTPTQAPAVATSFDAVKEQVKDFSGILPDPAPPAVDHDIDLQPPKR